MSLFSTIPQADLSPESLDRLDQRTSECGAAFARKVEKFESTIIDARYRFTRERQSMLDRALPDDRATVREIVQRDIERHTNELRHRLVESTSAERDELLAALTKHESELNALADLCASPGQMLGRVGLGDPRRTNIQQQLTGAGPVELTTAARDAVARRDLVAAAAVMTIVDRLPKADRPFSPAELAQAVMGEQHKAARQKIDAARERIRGARDLNQSFERGATSPMSRIEAGLAARRLKR